MVEFRAPRAQDIDDVVVHMRAADVQELRAAGQDDIRACVSLSVQSSVAAWAVDVDNRFVCLLGVAPLGGNLLSDIGVPWMLGTEGVRTHRRALMRRAPLYISKMLRAYPRLLNFVHAENTVAVKWLRHTGFRLAPAAPFGPRHAMFHRFEMSANV